MYVLHRRLTIRRRADSRPEAACVRVDGFAACIIGIATYLELGLDLMTHVKHHVHGNAVHMESPWPATPGKRQVQHS
jgi:nitrate reductase gamma subunit